MKKLILYILCILISNVAISQQGKNITGKVYDAFTKEAIPGAVIADTKTKIATKENGSFIITTNETKITVTAVGYEPKTISVSSENLAIAINPSQNILDQVVVTDTISATKAAIELQKMGVQQVIITMGSQGAFLYSDGKGQLIPAQKVEAVDTTAAGDTFNGALAVAIAEGKSLTEAVAFGNQAAAISVTRLGAQTSVPYLHELTINN